MNDTYADLKAKALAEINTLRSYYGQAPLTAVPRGWRCDPRRCPVREALAACRVVAVGTERYHRFSTDMPSLPLPLYLIQFVHAIDAGNYPELEVA